MENKSNADHKRNALELEGAAAHASIRIHAILTATPPVTIPGYTEIDRIQFIRNLISQHHWNLKWDPHFHKLRIKPGYICYFLYDHGQSPDRKEMLWYRWTGESLVPLDKAPSKTRRWLAEHKFIPPEGPEPPQIKRRKKIRAKLRHDKAPLCQDFEFLKENPEHRIWLEHNIEPRFWSKFKSLEAEWQRVRTRLARIIKRDPVENQPEQEKTRGTNE